MTKISDNEEMYKLLDGETSHLDYFIADRLNLFGQLCIQNAKMYGCSEKGFRKVLNKFMERFEKDKT